MWNRLRSSMTAADPVTPPEAASMPVPDGSLISRVAIGPDVPAFLRSGQQSLHDLERTLAIAGRSLESFESILDFGCGCGRMLLWMEAVGRSRTLYGTDIDPEAVAWCRAHIPFAQVSVNEPDPPLPYDDGSFDLVFNHSVFTHIDERRQDQWLTELRRVTRPGGLLVLSIHSETALPDDAWAIRGLLERDGIAFLDNVHPPSFPLPDWYQATFHAPWYIFEHWGRWFEIRGYVPGGSLAFQDHVLLERLPGDNYRLPVAARPTLVGERAPATRVVHALAEAYEYRWSPRRSRSRFGAVGDAARRLVLRAIRPYTAHEDNFDVAVVSSIAELTRASQSHSALLKEIERRTDDTPQ
jgi:SAM-dependent methyltransferase